MGGTYRGLDHVTDRREDYRLGLHLNPTCIIRCERGGSRLMRETGTPSLTKQYLFERRAEMRGERPCNCGIRTIKYNLLRHSVSERPRGIQMVCYFAQKQCKTAASPWRRHSRPRPAPIATHARSRPDPNVQMQADRIRRFIKTSPQDLCGIFAAFGREFSTEAYAAKL